MSAARPRWRATILPTFLSLTLAVAIVTDAGASQSRRVARQRASSYLQVTQVEYHLLLSRGVVKAGPVNLQEIDGGMDMHDLDLRRGTSPSVIAEPLLSPGQRYNTAVSYTHLGWMIARGRGGLLHHLQDRVHPELPVPG